MSAREDFVEVFARRKRGGPDLFDWRRIDGQNGQIIAGSASQGYVDEDFCAGMAARCNPGLQIRRPNPRGGYEVLEPGGVEAASEVASDVP